MTEENIAEEENVEDAPVKEESEISIPQVDLKAEIERVIEELWASEEKETPKTGAPSQEEFKKALSEVASKIESNMQSEYDSKLESKFAEMNERLEKMSAVRNAPKGESNNPFSKPSGEKEVYEAKKAQLERWGFQVRE
jgi:hypothetical protein